MVTPGMPGPLTGPPTWGMYPVTMGQTCMLPMVATGFPAIAVWVFALDYYCLLHYIYFKGGTFYAGHGAAHIGLHATFHIYILFAFHGSVHAVDGHILLGFDVYGTFGGYAGVAVALQGKHAIADGLHGAFRLVDPRSAGRQLGGSLVEIRRVVFGHTPLTVFPVDAFRGGILLVIVRVRVVVVQNRKT